MAEKPSDPNADVVSLYRIVVAVMSAAGLTYTEFAGRGKQPREVAAREMCVVLARRHTLASYPRIARAMGRPNHSTVIEANQRASARTLEAAAWRGAATTWGEFEREAERWMGVVK